MFHFIDNITVSSQKSHDDLYVTCNDTLVYKKVSSGSKDLYKSIYSFHKLKERDSNI